MDYVNSGIISANPLVRALDERVKDVKRNEKERMSYVKYEINLRNKLRTAMCIGSLPEGAVSEAD